MEFVLVRRPTKGRGKAWPFPVARSGHGCGDIENFFKPVADAMTKAGVYLDDSLIVEIASPTLKRWQAPREDFAGVVVRVELVG